MGSTLWKRGTNQGIVTLKIRVRVIRNLWFSYFAEVFWKSKAYHRGGYAYRLCKIEKVWDETSGITEECFQKGHLKFAGRWHFENV